MTLNELQRDYNKMCKSHEYCNDCKYNSKFSCELSFGYNKGRIDAINNFVIDAIIEFQKFDKEHGYPTLGDISVILNDVAKKLKEQK